MSVTFNAAGYQPDPPPPPYSAEMAAPFYWPEYCDGGPTGREYSDGREYTSRARERSPVYYYDLTPAQAANRRDSRTARRRKSSKRDGARPELLHLKGGPRETWDRVSQGEVVLQGEVRQLAAAVLSEEALAAEALAQASLHSEAQADLVTGIECIKAACRKLLGLGERSEFEYSVRDLEAALKLLKHIVRGTGLWSRRGMNLRLFELELV